MTPPKLSFLTQNQGWGSKKSLWGPLKVIKTSILHPKKEKKQIFSKNWTYMIWLSTVWDSHSTQLQGPTGRFDGQFIKLKICFQPGVKGKGMEKDHTKINILQSAIDLDRRFIKISIIFLQNVMQGQLDLNCMHRIYVYAMLLFLYSS